MLRLKPVAGAVLTLCLLWEPGLGQEFIHVIAMGSVDPAQSPIHPWLTTDPVFELSLVPTRLYDVEAITPEQARRMLRMYFPRNDEAMLQHDLVLFSGGDVRYFQPSHIEMIVRAVEAGVGSATDMGGMSRPLHDTWIASGLWEIFPNDALTIDKIWEAGMPADQTFSIVVERDLPSNPLYPFLPLGIEKLVGGRTRIIRPRPGSTVYAWMESESLLGSSLGFRPAASAIWRYGGGSCLALEAWLGHSWWSAIIDPTQNEYGQDILINYLLDVVGKPYLEDIAAVHAVRRGFREFGEHLSFLGSVLDFVERFGANVGPVVREAEAVREEAGSFRLLYLEGDVEGTLRGLQDSISRLVEIREKAMRARDRALQWIYIIEWLTISGTLMISGYAIDQLMIRRRLYRRAEATRHTPLQ
jgi:hypothetical protein